MNKSIFLLPNLVLKILEMKGHLQKQGLGQTEIIDICILEDEKWSKLQLDLFCESGNISLHLEANRK